MLPLNYHLGLRNVLNPLGNLWVLPWKASKRKLLGFFLALEARKKAKMQEECSQKRELKTSSKGRRELNSLLNSWNFENNSVLVGNASGEWDSMVSQ